MKPPASLRRRAAAALFALCSISSLSAGVLTWDGNALVTPAEDRWNEFGHWTTSGIAGLTVPAVPTDGSVLVFPWGKTGAPFFLENLTRPTVNDFLGGFSAGGLRFHGAGYEIRGNPLRLGAEGLRMDMPGGGSTSIHSELELTAPQSWTLQNAADVLTIAGRLNTGTQRLSIYGRGQVLLAGGMIGSAIPGGSPGIAVAMSGAGAGVQMVRGQLFTHSGVVEVRGGLLECATAPQTVFRVERGGTLGGRGQFTDTAVITGEVILDGGRFQPGLLLNDTDDAAFFRVLTSFRVIPQVTPAELVMNVGATGAADKIEVPAGTSLGDGALRLRLRVAENVQLFAGFFLKLITSAAPVSGSFAGLPFGTEFTDEDNRADWRLRRSNGPDNAIYIELVRVRPTGQLRLWSGGGATSQWLDAANWNGGTVPVQGFGLTFPDGVPANRKAMDHNLAHDATFTPLRFTAPGYSLAGRRLISSSIGAEYASGETVIHAPLLVPQESVAYATGGATLDFRGRITLQDAAILNLTVREAGGITLSGPVEWPGGTSGEPPRMMFNGSGRHTITASTGFRGRMEVRYEATLRVQHSSSPASHSDGETAVFGRLEFAAPAGSHTSFADLDVGGTVRLVQGAHLELGGTLHPRAGARLEAGSGRLSLTGHLHGADDFTLEPGPGESGRITLGGTAPVDLEGTMEIERGIVELDHAGPVFSQPGALYVGLHSGSVNEDGLPVVPGAKLRVLRSGQIADTALVELRPRSELTLHGADEAIGLLSLTEGNLITAAGDSPSTLRTGGITAAEGISIIHNLAALVCTRTETPCATGSSAGHILEVRVPLAHARAGGALHKTGAGKLRLTVPATLPVLRLSEGTVQMDTRSPQTTVRLDGSGILTGAGAGLITATGGGTISPGTSAGIMECSGLDLNPNTDVLMEIAGTAPGTGYDQLRVTGTVKLGGARFTPAIIGPFEPATGDSFVLVENDGADPVSGTFQGKPDGAVFAIGAQTFTLTYSGGTGNDIVLTRIVPVTATVRRWSGGGTDNNWSTPENWEPLPGPVLAAPAAGDTLIFPAGAARKTAANNLPAGRSYQHIRIEDSGYTLSGNTIVLTSGMEAWNTGGNVQWNIPLTLAQSQTIAKIQFGSLTFGAAINSGGHELALYTHPGAELHLNGRITGSGRAVTSGSGTVICGADNAAAEIKITEGYTLFHGSSPSLPVSLTGGGIGGKGRVGSLSMDAAADITPGNASAHLPLTDAGILTAAAATLHSTGTCTADLTGKDPATGYDQINAAAFEPNGATLRLRVTFTPEPGHVFTIVRHTADKPAETTFRNLPEGALIAAPGQHVFRISYKGGSGGDITLTTVPAPRPQMLDWNLTRTSLGPNPVDRLAAHGTGIPGAGYLMETSTTLQSWQPLSYTTADPSGAWAFGEIPAGPPAPRRFLRIRLE